MHCKSLWIKASAKCINVNIVSTTQDCAVLELCRNARFYVVVVVCG